MNKISELCYKIDSALDGTEINIANYNEDNVKKLNDAMIEVSLLLKELKEEAQRADDLYSLAGDIEAQSISAYGDMKEMKIKADTLNYVACKIRSVTNTYRE